MNRRTGTKRSYFLWLAIGAALLACSGEDNCAVEQENCAAQYLQQKGLTGCCSGLTCQDSPVTPGARVCR